MAKNEQVNADDQENTEAGAGAGAASCASKRPSAEEEQAREDLAYELISRGLLKSQIKKQFYKKYPGIVARTVERYLSRARERIAADVARGKEILRAESLAFYASIARDVQSAPRDKIFARERMDKVLGLDMPVKIAPTNPDGTQSYSELSDAELNARILALIAGGQESPDSELPASRSEGGSPAETGRESQTPGDQTPVSVRSDQVSGGETGMEAVERDQ